MVAQGYLVPSQFLMKWKPGEVLKSPSLKPPWDDI